jgi:hypothetical protein
MTGGYVLQKRDIVNPRHTPRTGESNGLILGEGKYGPGFPVTNYGYTDLRVHQETYSFRTGMHGDQADLTSGGEVLRYFLLHGIPSEFDIGHDFWTTKSWTDYSHKNSYARSVSGDQWIRGCISPGAPPVPVSSPLNVNFYGNRAIARVSPTSSNANLAQTAAEIIREKGIALPGTSLFGWLESRALFYRSIGKEYLNVSFGWKPFLNDLYSIARQMLDISGEIRKYSALSGLATVRRYDFQPIVSNTLGNNIGGKFLNVGQGTNLSAWDSIYTSGSGSGVLNISTSSYEKIYFKGRFLFALNTSNGFLNNIEAYEQLANKLLGTRITPSVLWELAPWSWLIDWFVDVQSAMQAAGLRLADGYKMQYGYLMRTSVLSETYTVKGVNFINGPIGPFTSTTTLRKVERVKGTPFGFGVNLSGISAGQWAILAALAISKGPNRLPRLPKGEHTD